MVAILVANFAASRYVVVTCTNGEWFSPNSPKLLATKKNAITGKLGDEFCFGGLKPHTTITEGTVGIYGQIRPTQHGPVPSMMALQNCWFAGQEIINYVFFRDMG